MRPVSYTHLLTIGNVQQEVQVSADAISPINTDTPAISAVYTAAEAANLPVNTRASATGTSALNICLLYTSRCV